MRKINDYVQGTLDWFTCAAAVCAFSMIGLGACKNGASKMETKSPATEVETEDSSQTVKGDSDSAKGPELTDNPLLQQWPGEYGGLPPYDKIELKHFEPALEWAMENTLARLDKIAGNTEKPTFENTLAAYERAFRKLNRVRSMFSTWSVSLSTPEFQVIEKKMMPKLAAFKDKVTQNEALFKRIEIVYKKGDDESLTSEQKRLAWKIYDDFVRQGAALDSKAKARLSEINQKLATLYTKFSQNVLADEKDKFLVLEGEKDLAGLPQSLIDSAAQAAKKRKMDGKWLILNTRSSIDPFLTYSTRRDLREKAWRLFTGRGDGSDKTDNNSIITEILAFRSERAKLLGYETHAHWQLQNTMAKKPEAVMALLNKVWAPAKDRVRREVADMQKIANRERKNKRSRRIKIKPWDYRHYAEKVRKKKYDLDESQIKPYLQLGKLREGMFWVAGELFDLEFSRLEDAPVFHPDATVWLAKSKSTKKPVGLFYFDPFARTGKRSGAWMSSDRDQERFDGEILPIVSNNCNFLKGKKGEPVLISWSDARTLFHEFGHALHGLLSNVNYPSLEGTSVARDYVELPSQILEHWLPTTEMLERFALHHKTGKSIPKKLVKRIENANTFNQGFKTVEFLASAFMDMKVHLSKEDKIDPEKFEKDTLNALGMPSEIVMRHRMPHFMHIFAGDSYSSGYYSYLWADVLTADAFEAFMEGEGPYDKTIAKRFHDNVLSIGNTIDPAVSYSRFRGKDAETAALMRKRGFPVPKKKKGKK